MNKKLFNKFRLKTFAICVFVFSVFLLFQNCEKDQEEPTGDLLSISECKSIQDGLKNFATDVPCVTIQTIDSNYLAIEHINAMFNCDYGAIMIDFSVTDNVINIKENQSKAGELCTCNYDIEYSIGSIEYGHYTINIEDESHNVISFEFDFSENTLVNYCNN